MGGSPGARFPLFFRGPVARWGLRLPRLRGRSLSPAAHGFLCPHGHLGCQAAGSGRRPAFCRGLENLRGPRVFLPAVPAWDGGLPGCGYGEAARSSPRPTFSTGQYGEDRCAPRSNAAHMGLRHSLPLPAWESLSKSTGPSAVPKGRTVSHNGPKPDGHRDPCLDALAPPPPPSALPITLLVDHAGIETTSSSQARAMKPSLPVRPLGRSRLKALIRAT